MSEIVNLVPRPDLNACLLLRASLDLTQMKVDLLERSSRTVFSAKWVSMSRPADLPAFPDICDRRFGGIV